MSLVMRRSDHQTLTCDILRDYYVSEDDRSDFEADYTIVYLLGILTVCAWAVLAAVAYRVVLGIIVRNSKRIMSPNGTPCIAVNAYMHLPVGAWPVKKVALGCEVDGVHHCPYFPTVDHPVEYLKCEAYQRAEMIVCAPDIGRVAQLRNVIHAIPNQCEWKVVCDSGRMELVNPFDASWLVGDGYNLRAHGRCGEYQMYVPTTAPSRTNHHRALEVKYSDDRISVYKGDTYVFMTAVSFVNVPLKVVDDVVMTMCSAVRDAKYDDMIRSYTLGRLKGDGVSAEHLDLILFGVQRLTDLATTRRFTQMSRVTSDCTTWLGCVLQRARLYWGALSLRHVLEKFPASTPWKFRDIPVPTYEVPQEMRESRYFSPRALSSVSRFPPEAPSVNSFADDGGQSSASEDPVERDSISGEARVGCSTWDEPELRERADARAASESAREPRTPNTNENGSGSQPSEAHTIPRYVNRVLLCRGPDHPGVGISIAVAWNRSTTVIEQFRARAQEHLDAQERAGRLDGYLFDIQEAINEARNINDIGSAIDATIEWLNKDPRTVPSCGQPVGQETEPVPEPYDYGSISDLFEASSVRNLGTKVPRNKKSPTKRGTRKRV